MKTKSWAIAITIILIFAFSIAAGYFVGAKAAENIHFDSNNIVLEEGESVSENEEKIYPYTQIIYEYYYPYEDETETKTVSAPYFMVGLTLEDMNEYYYDWQITYFSSQKVVMRKTIYDEKKSKIYSWRKRWSNNSFL